MKIPGQIRLEIHRRLPLDLPGAPPRAPTRGGLGGLLLAWRGLAFELSGNIKG